MQKPNDIVLNLGVLGHSVSHYISSHLKSSLSRLNLGRIPEVFSYRRLEKNAAAPLSAEEDVTTLQTSFSIKESLQRWRRRSWSIFDIQYVALASITITCLWMIEPAAPILKTAAFLGYMLLLLMPATSQFFLPSWPIWAYLLFFFSSRYVPLVKTFRFLQFVLLHPSKHVANIQDHSITNSTQQPPASSPTTSDRSSP